MDAAAKALVAVSDSKCADKQAIEKESTDTMQYELRRHNTDNSFHSDLVSYDPIEFAAKKALKKVAECKTYPTKK